MGGSSDLATLLRTYKKEIFLIVATATATFLFTKALPAIIDLAKRTFALLWAICSGRGKEYRFLRQYLHWVVKENLHSPVIPSQALDPKDFTRPPELDHVYIRIRLRRSNDEHIEVHFDALLKPGSKTVILGDPGAGKTTYLKYLALMQARRGLASPFNLRAHRAFRTKLETRVRRIPVLIYLNRLYRNETDTPASLANVARASLGKHLSEKCPPGFFEKLLESGTALVLLDGLDEIASSERRLAAAAEIGTLANAAHRETAWIVTSRVVGYKPKLQEYDFQLATVQHLAPKQVRQFVIDWYESKVASSGYKAEELEYQRNRLHERAQHLIDSLASNAGLQSLATSPMLVSLITMLHAARLEFPQNRALLYRDCVELLSERWDIYRGVNTDKNAATMTMPQKIAFLVMLARTMHDQNLREIRESAVAELLVREAGGETMLTVTAARNLIDMLLERSGLLILRGTTSSGERLLAFSHLSFQEYLVSTSLRTGDAEQFIIEHYTDSWWKEPLLLYVAQLEYPMQIAKRFCELAEEGGGLEPLLFAGHCLAEVQAGDTHPVFRRVLNHVAYVVSAATIEDLSTEVLRGDHYNVFLRYLVGVLAEIMRFRGAAAQALFRRRLGRDIDRGEVQAAIESASPLGDVGFFDRLFVSSAVRFGLAARDVLEAALRYPGAVQEIEGVTVEDLGKRSWADIARFYSRYEYPIDSNPSSSSDEWKPSLLARNGMLNRLTADAGVMQTLVHAIQRKDLPMARLAVRAISGRRVLDEPIVELGEAHEGESRLLIISALLAHDFLAPVIIEQLCDFATGVLNGQSMGDDHLDEWAFSLARRALRVVQRSKPKPSVALLRLVITCIDRTSRDAVEFALHQLWTLGPLTDRKLASYCMTGAEVGNLRERWAALLALANTRVDVDKTVQHLLSQFYDREDRIEGFTLRDVAAYSLMRLASTTVAEFAQPQIV